MSVILQSIKTEKYIEQADGWTATAEQARQFTGATEAHIYCCSHHLEHMKVLGQFADAKLNFSIPLNAGRWSSDG